MSNIAKRSIVWEHFDDTEEPKQKKCKTCSRTLLYNGTTTTSLLRHAKSHDPSINAANTAFKPVQVDKPAITQAITKMIVKDLQPFSITEQSGFRELLNLLAPQYTIPSRTTFSRSIIPKLYSDERSKLRTFLNMEMEMGIESAAFTVDGWTSRSTDGYLSMTMHFLTQSMELKRVMLNMRYLPHAHTASNLSEFLNNSLNEWGLSNLPTPIYFVTDNARNLTNAIKINANRWMHIPCFGHTLQLVVNDSIKECLELKEVLEKARSIVGYLNRSTKGATALEKAQESINPTKRCLKPIQDVATRWNSQFDMLSRLIELRDALGVAAREKDINFTNLSNDEWEIAIQFKKLFEPLKVATSSMSADTYPTASSYIPVIKTLKKFYTEFNNEALSEQMQHLRTKLITDLDSRFGELERGSEPLFLAMILDPRFKMRFLTPEQKQNAIELLKSKCSVFEQNKDTSLEELSLSSNIIDTSISNQFLHSLFGMDECNTTNSVGGSEQFQSQLQSEMDLYLAEPNCTKQTDVVEWWKNHIHIFPNLCRLAKSFLNIPATQTTSERLFSTCGNIVTADRANLLTEHVEEIAFLHENCI